MIMQARNKPKPGDLQKKLDAQKRMTDRDAVRLAAKQAVEQREVDAKQAALTQN
jgi:hypothetical protein